MEKVISRTRLSQVAPIVRQMTPLTLKRSSEMRSINEQVLKVQRIFKDVEERRRSLDKEIKAAVEQLTEAENFTTEEVKRNAKTASRNSMHKHVLEKLSGQIESLTIDKVSLLTRDYKSSVEMHASTVNIVLVMESDLLLVNKNADRCSAEVAALSARLDHSKNEALDMEEKHESYKQLLLSVNEECESLKLLYADRIGVKNKLVEINSQNQSEFSAEQKLVKETKDALANGMNLVKELRAKNDVARLSLESEEKSLNEQLQVLYDEITFLDHELTALNLHATATQAQNKNLQHRTTDLTKHAKELQRREEEQVGLKDSLLQEKGVLESKDVDTNLKTAEEKEALQKSQGDALDMTIQTQELDRKIRLQVSAQ